MMYINKSEGLTVVSDGIEIRLFSFGGLATIVCIVLAVQIALYVLRSLGIYTLAKRHGIKNAFIAWIPYAWIYTACKLIGETKIFGWAFEKLALIIMIIASTYGVFKFVVNYFDYVPIVGYILQGGEFWAEIENGVLTYNPSELVDFRNPFDTKAINVIVKIMDISNIVLNLVVLVATVFMYINLFRKFIPQHYVLYAVLSVVGLFPIFVFVIRKKEAVNYVDYLRSRYYYYNEPYGQKPPHGSQKPPEHPFEEFADKGDKDPGDPFAEFSDKDDK